MKTAIYCRLSDEDRDKRNPADDSESIQNQKTMLVQYAMQQGWEIFSIYSDDDFTGADRNRPEFNRLLADAEARKFDIILCKTQSRFTREMEYVEKYLHTLFPIWGIRFVSIVDNADTAVKGNKKARQINGLINEWYLEDLSENIKSVLTARRQNGFHIGAFSLYGYMKDPNQKGHLVIDEEAAPVVREVFSLFAQGYGKTNIARILNDRGIPNPTEYKRLKGLRYMPPKSKASTLWKYTAVAKMLENEIYIGHMVQGKYASVSYKIRENRPQPKEEWIKVENTHEPIISTELWNTVQSMLKAKAKPFASGKIGLFAHKCRCMHCGCVMRSSKSHGFHYLKCETRFVSKDACAGAFVPVKLLERTVREELKKLTNENLDKDVAERSISFEADYQAKRKIIGMELDRLRKKKDESSKAVKSLYLDKVNGILSEIEFSEMLISFRNDTARIDALIDDAETRLIDIENHMKNADSRRKLLESYIDIPELTREIVEKLIDCVFIGRKDPITKNIPIEIHWNF